MKLTSRLIENHLEIDISISPLERDLLDHGKTIAKDIRIKDGLDIAVRITDLKQEG